MKLKKVIGSVEFEQILGKKEIEITGIASHSKRVGPGYLFVAKRGNREDGMDYIEEAVSHGAVAILTDFPNPLLKNVTQLIHKDVVSCEARLAANYYRDPAHQLFTIGITGTNGKTSIAYLTKHLLDQLSIPTGLIGTIEYLIGSNRFEAERTTPDVITNHKLLREMVSAGCQAAVMEVSSHALEQKRVAQIPFDCAIFSNLTPEHLDYHGTMEAYFLAKQKLFTQLSPNSTAIVNIDAPDAQKIIQATSAQIFTVGCSAQATLQAHHIETSLQGTQFAATYQEETVTFQTSLIGEFNVSNCLLAMAVCLAKGYPLGALPPLLATFSAPSGRLERVENPAGFHLLIDYAHTPDALEQVLSTLKSMITDGKLITLFGCGGDRDQPKRPLMGEVAAKYSDEVILTSDNPRSEDPRVICEEICKGCPSATIQVDRKLAIGHAIKLAQPGDLILIAGKGHEAYQVFAHQTQMFDDKIISSELLHEICLPA